LSYVLKLQKSMKIKAKASYRIRNYTEYNAAFKQRGSITDGHLTICRATQSRVFFWISEEVVQQWHNEQKTGRQGAFNHYS
jgi:hypothetical protein